MRNKVYDVIVIGAGHAGCEAALAASRMGCKTLLLTINLDTIAWMPCNSSIGGPGRGQIVREIDALGGEMAQIADKATIHSRRSNTSKGPAVQAPFAIVDRRKYLLAMKYLLERTENLEVRQALIKTIEKNGKRFNVFSVFEEKFVGKTVVLSAGTFMQGEVVYGKIKEPAGRYSEVSAPEISSCLKSLGFRLGRFKTGTSPRISAEGIQLSEMEAQHPDDPAEPLSFWTKDFNPKGLLCYKTRTTGKTLRIISNHVKDIPLLAGEVLVAGARYCPSIEERVLKNPNRLNHPVFLQPQGVDNRELYIQGLSTSLPVDVQEELVRSVKGLENAVIMRPGYAVMYDF
ncbi:MAG: FAD-dependent oxidoreductase, partial [Actinomycetota bacterium]|nr:FAD-dependent oxidoreductase [Actinomycetota bacterium]